MDERVSYRGANGKGYIRNQNYYNKVSLSLAQVAEKVTCYEELGTLDELRALKADALARRKCEMHVETNLPQAPRKADDIVWCIERDNLGEIIGWHGYAFVAENNKCVIVAASIGGGISQRLVAESRDGQSVPVWAFPTRDVYSTQKDARAAQEKEIADAFR